MGEALSESLENYLEAILHIVEERPAARPKDIAARLGVNNSSVTGALRALTERGLVNYAPFDLITLTPDGQRAARSVARRHGALREFFERALGLTPPDADALACRMEHATTPVVLQRVQRFLDFAETCPRLGLEWLGAMGACGGSGGDKAACERCLTAAREVLAAQPKAVLEVRAARTDAKDSHRPRPPRTARPVRPTRIGGPTGRPTRDRTEGGTMS